MARKAVAQRHRSVFLDAEIAMAAKVVPRFNNTRQLKISDEDGKPIKTWNS
jgi:hypothetical protein